MQTVIKPPAQFDASRARGTLAQRGVLLFTYLYLMRFPFLTILAINAIWFGAFFTDFKPLLRGLFDIPSGWRVFLVSLAAFMTGWVAMAAYKLVHTYGGERFHLHHHGVALWKMPRKAAWVVHRVAFSLLVAPLIVCVIYESCDGIGWRVFIYSLVAFVGWVVSFGLLELAGVLREAFIDPDPVEAPPAQKVRGQSIDYLRKQCRELDNYVSTRAHGRGWRWRGWLRRKLGLRTPQLSPYWGCGYLKYSGDDDAPRATSVERGHWLALFLLAMSLCIYGGIGYLTGYGWVDVTDFPALAYVLLLLSLLCWALSMLAFFLDCYRIPVLAPVLLWFVASSYVLPLTASDNFYRVVRGGPRRAAAPAPAAAAAPAALRGDGGRSIIVVAANGGGIQAAAWTARVLTGLQKEFGDQFGGRVRLVSSVSGGSVGAMYFVSEYTPGGLPPDALDRIVSNSERSSLSAAAWGLVFPDFLRLVYPFYHYETDRGAALERAWQRRGKKLSGGVNGVGVTLGEWREGVEAGWRPASIFNATITDTGERLTMSTAEPPAAAYGKKDLRELFDRDDEDIAVVTAARLSASFPFVSPAARADSDGARPHVVDGGYYDNYGISSLVEWLDRELSKPESTVKRVLVLQIRGASSARTYTYDEAAPCPADPQQVYTRESVRGWLYQAYAPLATLLHVRDTGQLSRNDVELNLLRERWRHDPRGIQIVPTVFEFNGAEPPLSWHLTDKQRRNIDLNWRAETHGCNGTRGIQEVRQFLEEAAKDAPPAGRELAAKR
ncbi:MAG TPA: patatin-like phospholipase family protein [Pyrinomonadaceae bacterium]|jgi:hypothetical protein